jgi:hypothetical protein
MSGGLLLDLRLFFFLSGRSLGGRQGYNTFEHLYMVRVRFRSV